MKTSLKIYNTYSRKKELFKPIRRSTVSMYTCGPTVYSYQHIGNLRSYVFSDILRRTLEYNGFKVNQVINVTDVGHLESDADEGEDKVEIAAKREGKKVSEITSIYLNEFKNDFQKLNILKPSRWTKASKHIADQIDLVRKLEKKGYTYKTNDGIYFKSSKYNKYGKLAKLNIKGLKAGKRISQGEKRNKTDFALWKFSNQKGVRQQEWKSPWGLGFPGWHLECSAMAMKYLGNTLDIHTGGEDHIPVHHTNEIAQSEAATGKKFVNYWVHGAFLLNKGEKVSKSTGGLYTISELETQGYYPLSYRYLLLQTHYRKQLNFSLDNLDSAQNAYNRLRRNILKLKTDTHKGNDLTKLYEPKFLEAINDDLNLSKALDIFWRVLDDFDYEPKKKFELLIKFDQVLGLGIKNMKEEKLVIPKEIQEWLKLREVFRKEGKFQRADQIRHRIRNKGYIIEDTSKGPKLRRI